MSTELIQDTPKFKQPILYQPTKTHYTVPESPLSLIDLHIWVETSKIPRVPIQEPKIVRKKNQSNSGTQNV